MIDKTQLSTTFKKSFRYWSGKLLMGCTLQLRSIFDPDFHAYCCCWKLCLSFPTVSRKLHISPAQPFFLLAFTSDPGWCCWCPGPNQSLSPPPPPTNRLPLCSPLLPTWKANMGNLWKKVARESSGSSRIDPTSQGLNMRQTYRFLKENYKTKPWRKKQIKKTKTEEGTGKSDL